MRRTRCEPLSAELYTFGPLITRLENNEQEQAEQEERGVAQTQLYRTAFHGIPALAPRPIFNAVVPAFFIIDREHEAAKLAEKMLLDAGHLVHAKMSHLNHESQMVSSII